MIEEVKRIRLEELDKQKKKYREQREIITQKEDQIISKLSNLKREQENGITIRDDFSFLEKWVTRRKEYKKFKTQVKRASKLPKLISETEKELKQEEVRTKAELETSGIATKLAEISEEEALVAEAKTLWDMGITPEKAMKLLEDNGIQPVLSEADKCITEHPRDYSSITSLIGVHKTRYIPTANRIKSTREANVQYKGSILLNGKEYEYSYPAGRDTVHVAINDEVESHGAGNWDDCKYAILIPFKDIPRIAFAAPMDTFKRGGMDLTEDTWILAPEKEVDKIKALNPKVHVLGYEGENVQGYSRPFLTQLGYRAEECKPWSWKDEVSTEQFINLMEKENIKLGAHTYTSFREDEDAISKINKAVALSKLVRDHHLMESPENAEQLKIKFKELLDTFGIESDAARKGLGDSNAIVANHRQADIFLEEMGRNGFHIAEAYQEVIRNVCQVSVFGYEDNKNEIFAIPENATEEEREKIEELKDDLTKRDTDKKGAFADFISTVVCDTILHSKEREGYIENSQEEQKYR